MRSLLPGKIIVCPDNDDAGRALVKKIYWAISPYFRDIWFVAPPNPFKDWNDLDIANGSGASKEYISNNLVKLLPPVLFKM